MATNILDTATGPEIGPAILLEPRLGENSPPIRRAQVQIIMGTGDSVAINGSIDPGNIAYANILTVKEGVDPNPYITSVDFPRGIQAERTIDGLAGDSKVWISI